MQRLLPPALVLLLIGVMALANWLVPLTTVLEPPWTVLGLIPIIAGLALTAYGGSLFGRVGTNIKTFNDPNTLVDSGIFARTRNPMYLGFTVLLVGAAIVFGSLSVWIGPIAFFAAANYWYIPFEERRMAATFGDDYRAYQARVPRWLGAAQ